LVAPGASAAAATCDCSKTVAGVGATDATAGGRCVHHATASTAAPASAASMPTSAARCAPGAGPRFAGEASELRIERIF